jgi:hypothetical protein
MHVSATHIPTYAHFPVIVRVEPMLTHRNRWTTFFRPLLALPHLILVGGPAAAALWWTWRAEPGNRDWSAGGGVLGAVAVVCGIIAWFAILFTGQYPKGLRKLVTLYLRWRVNAMAYLTLLRDEYPPFGDGRYPARFEIEPPAMPRNKVSVAFRLFLVIPHLIVLWLLGVAWFVTTLIGWFAILFTGEFPALLYHFGIGMLRWNIRVEAYALLLTDEYPPFSLEW